MTLYARDPSLDVVKSLCSIVLLLFPVVVFVVLNFKIAFPELVTIALSVQYFMVFELAPLINSITEVVPVEGFVIVKSVKLPVAFTRPSMVIFEAPLS